METKAADSEGLVQKKFNCKSGAGNMDRVAFYINLKNEDFEGETFGSHGDVIVDFGAVRERDARARSSWETIKAPVTPGCGEVEFTDGAGQEEEWDEPKYDFWSGEGGANFWSGESGAFALMSGAALAATLLITS